MNKIIETIKGNFSAFIIYTTGVLFIIAGTVLFVFRGDSRISYRNQYFIDGVLVWLNEIRINIEYIFFMIFSILFFIIGVFVILYNYSILNKQLKNTK